MHIGFDKKGPQMDICALAQACATGIACGGFEALGAALSAATIKLFKLLSDKMNYDEQNIELRALTELAQPDQFAEKANNLAREDKAFRLLLKEWSALATEHAKSSQDIAMHHISNSNIANGVSGSNITITQTVDGVVGNER